MAHFEISTKLGMIASCVELYKGAEAKYRAAPTYNNNEEWLMVCAASRVLAQNVVEEFDLAVRRELGNGGCKMTYRYGSADSGAQAGDYFVVDQGHDCWTVFEVDYEDWLGSNTRLVNKPLADHASHECAQRHLDSLINKTTYRCGCDDE